MINLSSVVCQFRYRKSLCGYVADCEDGIGKGNFKELKPSHKNVRYEGSMDCHLRIRESATLYSIQITQDLHY